MIKLDEKDVRSVANSRFTKKYKWWIIGSGTCIFLAVPGIGLLSSPESWTSFLIFIPLVLGLGLSVLYFKKSSKAEKALIEEWKKETESDTNI